MCFWREDGLSFEDTPGIQVTMLPYLDVKSRKVKLNWLNVRF